MDRYIVMLNDVNSIDRKKDSLISKCKTWANLDFEVYKSFSFVGGTGFTQYVFDEIDLVIQSQASKHKNYLSFKDFVDKWKFEEYLGHKVEELSGGWKKFLSLALFTNLRSQAKVYFDASRQLSDRLVKLFVGNLDSFDHKVAFFFEYDVSILSQYGCTLLYDQLDRLSEDGWCDELMDARMETNYDRT